MEGVHILHTDWLCYVDENICQSCFLIEDEGDYIWHTDCLWCLDGRICLGSKYELRLKVKVESN